MLHSLDNLIEGCQLIGFDWRYLYVNKAVVKQGKYASEDDLIGYTMMEKYPSIEKTELFRVLRKCMDERVSEKIENEFVFHDNSRGWFELLIRPVPQGIFILSVEVTERKHAEQMREEYIKVLEEMMFTVSHKVRQPIANIMGISNLLTHSALSQEELFAITNYIKQSIHSLDTFTKELLAQIEDQRLRNKEANLYEQS